MIYYLADLKQMHVRIGYTTPRVLKARLYNHQSSNAQSLFLLGVHTGTCGTEKSVHLALGDHRVRGEWFHLNTDVLSYVDEHVDSEYFFDVFEDDLYEKRIRHPIFAWLLNRYQIERNNWFGPGSDFVLIDWIDWISEQEYDKVMIITQPNLNGQAQIVEEKETQPGPYHWGQSVCP